MTTVKSSVKADIFSLILPFSIKVMTYENTFPENDILKGEDRTKENLEHFFIF